MSLSGSVLWLNVSPSLSWLHAPLLQRLARSVSIARWNYSQTLAAPSALDSAIARLHQYLQARATDPLHLVGHGLSAAFACQYADRYPQQVRSLTLLSVAPQEMATWHLYYYLQRQQLSICRIRLLMGIAQCLLGGQSFPLIQRLALALDRDLEAAPSLYSLLCHLSQPNPAPSVPVLLGNSQDDAVVKAFSPEEWANRLPTGSCQWLAPAGRHFFHYFAPDAIAHQMFQFWGLGASSVAVGVPTSVRVSSLPVAVGSRRSIGGREVPW